MARRPSSLWAALGLVVAACGSRSALDVDVARDAAADDVGAGGDDARVAIDVAPTADTGLGIADAPPVTDLRGCPASGQAVLATGEPFPTGIAVDATNVYWATGNDCSYGRIRSMPKTGGPITTLADHQADPLSLVVDASFAYWYNACVTRELRRVPLGGGTVFDYAISVDPKSDASELAADSRNLYYNSYGVRGIPKAGGAQFTVQDAAFVYSLVADDRGVYWLGPIGPGQMKAVFAFPTGASAPSPLALGLEINPGIALDESWVYFDGFGLQRVPRAGGAVETPFPPSIGANEMTVDGTSLYWSDPTDVGYAVYQGSKDGGSVTQIAGGAGDVYRLVLDEHCVYWTNPTENTIETAAKVGM
jgi:hypothetical protein